VKTISYRGVFSPTIEDEEVSDDPDDDVATDSEEPPQTLKPRGFESAVQSWVDDQKAK